MICYELRYRVNDRAKKAVCVTSLARSLAHLVLIERPEIDEIASVLVDTSDSVDSLQEIVI